MGTRHVGCLRKRKCGKQGPGLELDGLVDHRTRLEVKPRKCLERIGLDVKSLATGELKEETIDKGPLKGREA